MKRGQQTCKEPKLRQCVLITGNRNMSALMSASFYLEMKMHLRCPDPLFIFFLSILEQNWDTHVRGPVRACTHMQMLRVLFPNRKRYQRNKPTGCVYFQKQRTKHKSQLQTPVPVWRREGKG
uniref:Uncharacterized protein n=1 Tax=Rousettus aegyptiacus TaxID=9407 RepID=A0A7J8HT53_ROUAE|nr:hypothetical protein HJG63_011029 [Rousettus aegyptiacus]